MTIPSKSPSFTIVTVVYNGESEIEKTLLSCIGQDYTNTEYIVVDGNSEDKTLEIVNKYHNMISCIISEPDKGIYDAMNKAIEIATGDWIIFMNCGDTFCDQKVLLNVGNFIQERASNTDILYGNTIYNFKNVLLKIKPMPFDKIEREMIFCHQSTFVRTDLIKKSPFDLQYKLAADYEMMYRFYKQGKRFYYFDLDVSIFNQNEGSTLKNFKQSTLERFSIHNDSGSFKNFFLLYKTIFKIQMSLFIKKMIPIKMNEYLFNLKNRNKLTINE